MSEERVRCLNCMRIRQLTDEEMKLDVHAMGLCSGEGGTKDLDDITAWRKCSRYLFGENDLPLRHSKRCDQSVKCLECENLVKIPYIQARPTHHENWECPKKGVTKQFEDCEALRCCDKYSRGKFKNKA